MKMLDQLAIKKMMNWWNIIFEVLGNLTAEEECKRAKDCNLYQPINAVKQMRKGRRKRHISLLLSLRQPYILKQTTKKISLSRSAPELQKTVQETTLQK
jgi:hypothetical protein